MHLICFSQRGTDGNIISFSELIFKVHRNEMEILETVGSGCALLYMEAQLPLKWIKGKIHSASTYLRLYTSQITINIKFGHSFVVIHHTE